MKVRTVSTYHSLDEFDNTVNGALYELGQAGCVIKDVKFQTCVYAHRVHKYALIVYDEV